MSAILNNDLSVKKHWSIIINTVCISDILYRLFTQFRVH
jgi:hypothetical protein